MDKSQQLGLKNLVRRKESENLVFFQTDKSGKMTVDQIDNFCNKMGVHVEAGYELEGKFVLKEEKELNARSKSWARIL